MKLEIMISANHTEAAATSANLVHNAPTMLAIQPPKLLLLLKKV